MFSLLIDPDISLALLQLHHADLLFALIDHNRSHLRTWQVWVDQTKTVNDSRDFIQRSLQSFAEQGNPVCGIWYQNSLVGVIGMHGIDLDNFSTSIGYWLSASHQGKGIMTRACAGLIDYAFLELKLHRVWIEAAVHNHKSRAIPQRLGFTEEGILRQSHLLNDRYVDMVQYGLLAEEWTSQ